MTTISIIVATDKNNVIGKNNKIPWHVPEDLKWFKKHTFGKPIIMGRKTRDAIGKKLAGRTNIVVTRNADYKLLDGTFVSNSINDAIMKAKSEDPVEIFIIGGEQIYREALLLVSRLYITKIYSEFDGDSYFPEIDMDEWEVREEISSHDNNFVYDFKILYRIPKAN